MQHTCDFLLPPHVVLYGHIVFEECLVTTKEKGRALNATKAYVISNSKLMLVMKKIMYIIIFLIVTTLFEMIM